jgi:Na+/H+-translocating membrane pyrophosphatase
LTVSRGVYRLEIFLVMLAYSIDYSQKQKLIFVADALAGFGFGASSIALFTRVTGGIFTKAADIGT